MNKQTPNSLQGEKQDDISIGCDHRKRDTTDKPGEVRPIEEKLVFLKKTVKYRWKGM